jgi:hypothetical protein
MSLGDWREPEPDLGAAGRLRPLRVGEVVAAASALYGRNVRTMLAITAAVVIPLTVIQDVVLASGLSSSTYVRNGTLHTGSGPGSPPAGFAVEFVVGLIALLLVTGALCLCAVDAYIGRPLRARESLRAAARRLAPLLWMAIVYGIVLTVALILFVIPGIWLAVMWAVAIPALMVEGLGGVGALRRSFGLVRHRWWATFAALVVAVIVLFVVGLVVGLVLDAIRSGLGTDSVGVWFVFSGLGTVIVDLVGFPFIGALIAVIYIDQRVRKEALDIEVLTRSRRGTDARPDVPWDASPQGRR